MEIIQKNEKINNKYPEKRKLKSEAKDGKLDDEGFFRTPNGSFWDPDNEYFNREGFDVHGGFYTKDLEYIEGPSWIPELGCYEDEKEKYANINWEDELLEDDGGLDLEGAELDMEEEEEDESSEKKKKKKAVVKKPKKKKK